MKQGKASWMFTTQNHSSKSEDYFVLFFSCPGPWRAVAPSNKKNPGCPSFRFFGVDIEFFEGLGCEMLLDGCLLMINCIVV